MNPDPDTPDTADLLRGVHARLLPADSLTPEIAGSMRYARLVADDLVFAYALDQPMSVRILTDADVAGVGHEELGQAAYTNLMRTPVTHEEIPYEGTILHSFHGESHFVGSQALHLSAAVHRMTGESLPHAGALVVMPSRHNLVYHPIADGTVVEAVNHLATYALGAYEDGAGKLSPRVYWWHRGALKQLTVLDEETRTLSIQPPPHLLGMMKGLVRLDRAGRLATRATAQAPAPDLTELTNTTAESIESLAEDPTAGLGDAFTSAVTLAHTRCAADPEAAGVDTWDAWSTAVQLGTALFTGAQPQDCNLGGQEVLVRRLPATPAAPPADARAWLDALYLAIVCREGARIRRLCQVPLETLRQDDSVDTYVLHWIDTLQTFFSERDSMDGVVEKLLATMKTSGPEDVTHAPMEFVNSVDYQPVALFHRLIARDPDTFATTLTDALAAHETYWSESAAAAPRAQVALGPLAMASLAYDHDFPVAQDQRYLPLYLLNRKRIETIPNP